MLTNTFALNCGFTIDVKVLCGESKLGKFQLYKENEDWDEFVFSVEYAKPKRTLLNPLGEKYTHWHPQSREQALEDVVAFIEGTHKYVL